MPIIPNSTYQAKGLYKKTHFNTIIPNLFRRPKNSPFQRERITTPDDDFLDLDWSTIGGKQLVLLLHGLEGSSQSKYIRGMTAHFNKKEWDAVALNYRGCSGEPNRQLRTYHMAATEDIGTVVTHLLANYDYETIALVGFSLGGNLLLNYFGEQGENLPKKIKAGVAFSVPCHIPSGNIEINKSKNCLYLKRFTRSLDAKAKLKYEQFPKALAHLKGLKTSTFDEFDEAFTAPVHGYKDAQDYWTRASSVNNIPTIARPTLLVNALDDTFLSKQCFPKKLAEKHPYFYLETPDHGGHCGFMSKQKDGSIWSEERAFEFIEKYT